ncbi:unnamed protein product [Lactuca saligna]|uniref:Uncharacterized protein n=1 Tax=Lactuca saligna TaxID=75948 RepID=A0AA36A3X7_LACSI|nr:unnamed protein product [Lactuca saligna]
MNTPAVACLPLRHLYHCRMSVCREGPLRSTPPLERSSRRFVVGSQDGHHLCGAISPSVAAATSLLRSPQPPLHPRGLIATFWPPLLHCRGHRLSGEHQNIPASCALSHQANIERPPASFPFPFLGRAIVTISKLLPSLPCATWWLWVCSWVNVRVKLLLPVSIGCVCVFPVLGVLCVIYCWPESLGPPLPPP